MFSLLLKELIFYFYLSWSWKPIKVHVWTEPRHDKTNKMSLRHAKTQISLGIHPVWSESSLCAHWAAKDPRFLHADSEDSDQTGQKPRLIWVFAGRTLILLVLSCRGSTFRMSRNSYLKKLQCTLNSKVCTDCDVDFPCNLPPNYINENIKSNQ